jgi:hypothetical protein
MRISLGAHEYMAQRTVSPWQLFLTIMLACGIAVVYALHDQPLPPLPAALVVIGPLSAVLHWLHGDARARGRFLVYDWGFLVLSSWPFFIPWYVYRTRGPHGWPLTLWLLLAIFGPALVGTIILNLAPLLRGGTP